jgi:predicted nucleic acid-binding protein
LADNAKKVYWDACVWLSLINDDPGRADRCRHLVEQAKQGDVQIWTSSITLAEVFKKKCEGKNISLPETGDEGFENLLNQDFVYEVQADHDIGVLARRLLRKYPALKQPNDAIHAATAALNNIDELHSFDGDNLTPLNGLIDKRDGTKLIICEPPAVKNVQLDLTLTNEKPAEQ